jgi:hypothetical protein
VPKTKQKKLHFAINAVMSIPAAVSLTLPTTAQAVPYASKASGAWEATGSTTWITAGSPGAPAGSTTDTVTINAAAGSAVTYSGSTAPINRTIASLLIGNTAKNTLTITGGSLTVTNASKTAVTTVGTGAKPGTGNQNTLFVQGGALTTDVLNNNSNAIGSGLVSISGGTLNSTSFNNKFTASGNEARVTVSAGSLSNSGTFTNNGLVTVSGTGSLSSGTFTNTSKGVVTVSGGTLTGTGIDNANTISVTGGSFGGATTAYTQTGGSLEISGGSHSLGATSITGGSVTVSSTGGLTLTQDATVGAGGTVNVQNNGTLTNAAGQTLSNAGTVSVSGGTLSNQGIFSNTGTVSISGGSLSGGTLTTSGAVNLSGAGTADVSNLSITGGGTVSLAGNGNTIQVSNDYTNSGFGTGNDFDAHAGVSGLGAINSSSPAAQSVTGDNITNGPSATPTLTFGNVHVGQAATTSYSINNAAGGPILHGAIKNGGAVDPRLAGSGVTAGNWDLAANSSTSKDVTLTVGSAGAYTLNQTITLANNFDNVADQTLTIKNADGAAAYDYASASISPLNIGNVREGSAGTGYLSVSNAVGPFRENLDASFSGNKTGDVASTSGTITGLAAGSTNNNGLLVGINTGTAGAKSGTVEVNLVSNGSGTSGLGNTQLDPQTVNVTGNVYRLATGGATPTPINFAATHVGQTATQALTITNTATNDGFSEKLDASFGANAGSATNNGGTVNLLATSDSPDSSSMAVGLDTSSAGAKTGSVTVNYFSDGAGTTNQGPTANGSQTINVTGDVYNYANIGLQKIGGTGLFTSGNAGCQTATETCFTLDFANLIQGNTYIANLSVLNSGIPDAVWTDLLDVLYGSLNLNGVFGLTPSDPTSPLPGLQNIIAGTSRSLNVTIDTSTLGINLFTGDFVLSPWGHNASGYSGQDNLKPIHVFLSANVIGSPPPNPTPEPGTLWLFGSAALWLAGRGLRRT